MEGKVQKKNIIERKQVDKLYQSLVYSQTVLDSRNWRDRRKVSRRIGTVYFNPNCTHRFLDDKRDAERRIAQRRINMFHIFFKEEEQ